MQMSRYNKYKKILPAQGQKKSKARLDTANAIPDDEVQNEADIAGACTSSPSKGKSQQVAIMKNCT